LQKRLHLSVGTKSFYCATLAHVTLRERSLPGVEYTYLYPSKKAKREISSLHSLI